MQFFALSEVNRSLQCTMYQLCQNPWIMAVSDLDLSSMFYIGPGLLFVLRGLKSISLAKVLAVFVAKERFSSGTLSLWVSLRPSSCSSSAIARNESRFS